MNKFWILLAVLVPNLVLAQPAVTVETDRATREDIAATMAVSGVVISREDALIASELNSRLVWIAEVGGRFREGEVIAQLDTHLIELEQADREAEIAALKASLEWLQRQTRRLDELATANNTAHSELDETRARFLVLEQELAQAEVGLKRTHYDLDRASVRAPFDGIVVAREMSMGEYAAEGNHLLRLVNTTAAEISVTAPLRLARYSNPGDRVYISNGESTAEATIRSVITVGDIRSHMMELRLTPMTQDWLIGEAMTVELPASEQQHQTTVSRDAVVLRDRNNYVYVVKEDSTAQRVDIELGAGSGERITVLGAVQPGDEVVIRGAELLRDGQKVTPLSERVTMR